MNYNQSKPSVGTDNGSEQPTASVASPGPTNNGSANADSTPAPILARPRSDGLLSKLRPYNDRTLFRAFAEQQMREFQGYADQQQDAFQKFMEMKGK